MGIRSPNKGFDSSSVFIGLVHSHKKQHSVETCARLLFMLLQDFFASARFHRVHKIPKSAVHYLYYLKLNNTISQRKTTNSEKHFSP